MINAPLGGLSGVSLSDASRVETNRALIEISWGLLNTSVLLRYLQNGVKGKMIGNLFDSCDQSAKLREEIRAAHQPHYGMTIAGLRYRFAGPALSRVVAWHICLEEGAFTDDLIQSLPDFLAQAKQGKKTSDDLSQMAGTLEASVRKILDIVAS